MEVIPPALNFLQIAIGTFRPPSARPSVHPSVRPVRPSVRVRPRPSGPSVSVRVHIGLFGQNPGKVKL
eukprot:217414-Prymnesium_polylepis.1